MRFLRSRAGCLRFAEQAGWRCLRYGENIRIDLIQVVWGPSNGVLPLGFTHQGCSSSKSFRGEIVVIADIPSWRNERLATMVRCALWLVAEVGVGEVFTKTQLREAFPETSQIDRRMRDLRDRGWRIATNRDDATLSPSEHRFVEMGAEVWKPGQSRVKQAAAVSAPQRREILDRDDHLCRVCGITAGEPYEGGIETAQLDLARREVVKPGGVVVELVTECRRCRIGGRGRQTDVTGVLGHVGQMSRMERELFTQWVAADRRDFSLLERLWGQYRSLPAESRETVRQALERA